MFLAYQRAVSVELLMIQLELAALHRAAILETTDICTLQRLDPRPPTWRIWSNLQERTSLPVRHNAPGSVCFVVMNIEAEVAQLGLKTIGTAKNK